MDPSGGTPDAAKTPIQLTKRGETGPVRQIFVSYSRSDRLAVDQLVRDLRARHHELWMDVDEQGIEPGEDWQQELIAQMHRSVAVVACVSPDFLRSKYCRAEIDQARSEHTPIYPAIVRRLDAGQSLADMNLGNLQYVDLTQDYPRGVRQLSRKLPRPRFPQKFVMQRLGIAGGLALASVVILLLVVLAATVVPSLVLPTPTLLPTPSPLPPTPTAGFVSGEHDVTVAVAPFAIHDASVDVAEADLLVLRFSNLLDYELRAILNDPALRSERLTYGLLGPKVLERVEGTTLREREKAAAALAGERGVDVVVFGEIRRASPGGPLRIQPEFYVNPETYFEAQEITGPQRFGTEIEVDDTQADFATPSAQNARGELSSRTTALAQVVIGLSRYAFGDYRNALRAFQQAQTVPNWAETHGREILNVLIGNSYLKEAQEYGAQCNREQVLALLDEARSQYEIAQELNPNYSRAWAGLASLSYALAQWKPVENAAVCDSPEQKAFYIDLDELEQAREYAQEALLKVVQPLSAGVRTRVLFTQAEAVFGLYASEGRSAQDYAAYFAELMTITDQIIALIDEPGVEPMALDAYYLRASADLVEGDCPAALDEYEAFMRRVPADPNDEIHDEARRRRMFFTEMAAHCQLESGQSEAARQLYAVAIQIAKILDSDFDVTRLEQELETLNGDDATDH